MHQLVIKKLNKDNGRSQAGLGGTGVDGLKFHNFFFSFHQIPAKFICQQFSMTYHYAWNMTFNGNRILIPFLLFLAKNFTLSLLDFTFLYR